MGPTKENLRRRRPALLDRLELWLSTHRHVDGLWVGTYEQDSEFVLSRVDEALGLIKAYDQLRYVRLTRDLDRVWVRTLIDGIAQFNETVDACEIDIRFVLDPTSSPAMIASTIVHEATHARLARCRIGYKEELRARVEAVCLRRELAFAKKLPNGAQVRDQVEGMLEFNATNARFWTDASFKKRGVEGAIEALRYMGLPMSLVRPLVGLLRCVATSRWLRDLPRR